MGEIVHSAAMPQGMCHHISLAVHVGGRDIVGLQVVGGGVHDGESALVHPYPGLFAAGVCGVEQGHVGQLSRVLRSHVLHLVVRGGGVAVLPQDGFAVGGHGTGNDSRGAGPRAQGRQRGQHARRNRE